MAARSIEVGSIASQRRLNRSGGVSRTQKLHQISEIRAIHVLLERVASGSLCLRATAVISERRWPDGAPAEGGRRRQSGAFGEERLR